ncbi:hypothetical protein CY34DRAFT_24652 [Suillus luteus UH-Slu-Lm8-n1]|uniref:Uncharacterized protein n=1 Tax=Suillus luteus UH-Slu-Lm8-n1 TaxID=930992 RepID=A0A0D0BB37_9AGAM|nr:hypothetical protein CY34DRAFT_24652 [Suillus luteus UH-Slu-Lm8-n1]
MYLLDLDNDGWSSDDEFEENYGILTKFVSGVNSLQAHHTHAICAHLDLIVWSEHVSADVAERAAEANGFAAAWGGHQLRCHAKIATLLTIPSIATKLHTYLGSNKWKQNVINDEMPNALKRYIELELFPCIHLKVGRGILLSTAHHWLHHEGFWYMSYKKRLYFDGHDQPDIFKLQKKEVGRGIHCSDMICSTCGHLSQAGEFIKYGKNYEGVLFIIDNSQGHSAYAEYALRVGSHMNVKPGSKQAQMWNRWFVHNGVQVEQVMVFAASHSKYPNQPKGRVKKYLHDNCDSSFKTLKTNMLKALESVQVNTVQLWEHHMYRWIEAYRSGLPTKEAQLQVQKFSSTKYKSHRHIPETVARVQNG